MPVKKKSPSGYEEYFSDPEEFRPFTAGITRQDIRSGQPYSVYNNDFISGKYKDMANETLTHERIHQGQYASGIPVWSDRENQQKLFNSLRPYMNAAYYNEYTSRAGGPLEPPAYAFENVEKDPKRKKDQQAAFNNYIKFLLSSGGEGRIHNVMAPMPVELQKGYISSGPAVAPPGLPPENTQESFSKMLLRALSTKK